MCVSEAWHYLAAIHQQAPGGPFAPGCPSGVPFATSRNSLTDGHHKTMAQFRSCVLLFCILVSFCFSSSLFALACELTIAPLTAWMLNTASARGGGEVRQKNIPIQHTHSPTSISSCHKTGHITSGKVAAKNGNIESYRAKQSAAVANGELKQTEQKQNKNNHAAQEHKTRRREFHVQRCKLQAIYTTVATHTHTGTCVFLTLCVSFHHSAMLPRCWSSCHAAHRAKRCGEWSIYIKWSNANTLAREPQFVHENQGEEKVRANSW